MSNGLLEIHCPTCGTVYHLPPAPNGCKITCQVCNHVIQVPPSAPAQQPPAPVAVPVSNPVAPNPAPAPMPPNPAPPQHGAAVPMATPVSPTTLQAPTGPLPPHLAGADPPATASVESPIDTSSSNVVDHASEMKDRYKRQSSGMGLIWLAGASVILLIGVGILFMTYKSRPEWFHFKEEVGPLVEQERRPSRSDIRNNELSWANAKSKSVLRNDIKVAIERVWYAPVHARSASNAVQSSSDPYLQIHVKLENVGDRRVEYQSWYGNEFQVRGQKAVATLRDDSGKPYQMMTFGDVTAIQGHIDGASLTTKSVGEHLASDAIIYEVPPSFDFASTKYFRLELPAASIGGVGWIRFEIPTDMIEKR